MSEPYNNEMRFALFRNDKGDNEKRPDYRGTMQIAGIEYELSGWKRTSKAGETFLSGTVKVKQPKPQPDEPAPTAEPVQDVPF